MKVVFNYFLMMIPYILIVFPFYLVIRYFKLKGDKKINYYHEIALAIFVMFIIGLASQTVIPKFEFTGSGLVLIKNRVHENNFILFKFISDTYHQIIRGNYSYFIINIVGNIMIFMPIGFFIPLLWEVSNKKVVLIGFCSSLFVEASQLLLARTSDIDDLLLNTIGIILGLLVYNVLYKKHKKFLLKYQKERH